MDIEALKSRVYFLAGQLEEAKKIFQEAVNEINEANKKATGSTNVGEPTPKD